MQRRWRRPEVREVPRLRQRVARAKITVVSSSPAPARRGALALFGQQGTAGKPEEVGAALASGGLPGTGVRSLVVVLVAAVLAAPWWATWAGLLSAEVSATEVGAREVVRLRPELVLLPGGRFMMGSPETEVGRGTDEVQHEVELSPFFLCRTEVTNEHWKAIMGSSPSNCKYGCGDDQPVQNVSWEQATEFLNRLTDHENELFPSIASRTRCYAGDGNATWVEGCTGYRLPTEAEWEYAARAGTRTAYSFGDDPKELCKYGNGAREECDDGAAYLADVARYASNPWGLFDMHGNVWEWTWDWYADNYGDNDNVGDKNNDKETRNPKGPLNGFLRVLRGGSFWYGPWRLRSAYRYGLTPKGAVEDRGLRCARGSPRSP